MTNGVEGFLTRKVGPLPIWAYAGVLGGGAILFYLYRRGQSASSAQTSGALAVPSGVSPDGASIQGILPPSPANPPPGTGPTPAPSNILQLVTREASPGQWPQGVPVWDAAHTGASIAAYLPYGGSVMVTGAPTTANGFTWYPVTTPGGGKGWISSNLVAGFGGGDESGMGGGSMVALFGDGRHANPGAVLGPHLLTQHVALSGMGGRAGAGAARHGITGKTGGQHSGALHAIHQRTGAPMIRLLSLNPGLWRPGSGQSGRYARIQ